MGFLPTWITGEAVDSGLSEIYTLGVEYDLFVNHDVEGIYKKILTDCIQRTQGISDKVQISLWDNCLESETKKGLISLLAEAMACKNELYLVYNAAVQVLRPATETEKEQIRVDYRNSGKSSVGVFISFRNYKTSDILKIFSGMEYYVISSLWKSMNLAKAVQIKMANMRESVGATDKEQIIQQAKSIAEALRKGNDILLDAEDDVKTASIDMSPTEKAIYFINAKKAHELNMPLSYINGEQTPGIGSTGEADTKAVERGLGQYWISIVKPALQALFGINAEFKSQDFRMISSALEAVKVFELVSEDMISLENKRMIVAKLLDIDDDLKDTPREPVEVPNDIPPTQTATEKNSAKVQNKAAG